MPKIKASAKPKVSKPKSLPKLKDKYQQQLEALFSPAEAEADSPEANLELLLARVAKLEEQLVRAPLPDPAVTLTHTVAPSSAVEVLPNPFERATQAEALPGQTLQRFKSLFKGFESLIAHVNGETPAGLHTEFESVRAHLRELETQLVEDSVTNSVEGLVAVAPSSVTLLYDKDRAGYIYADDKLESLERLSITKKIPDHAFSLPLIASGETIGAIQIETPGQRSWTTEEMDLASDVAKQASLQIQNLRLLSATERARAEAEAATRRFTHEGWASYLDAINQKERIGYAYDQAALTLYLDKLQANAGLHEPVLVADEQVGELYIQSDPARPLTTEDRNMVAVVGRQVAQQVENLRLLADASRARAEAEAATRRLTQESWKSFSRQKSELQGFMYDTIEVLPMDKNFAPQELSLTQPLIVRGETIGQLAVVGWQDLSPEAVHLAAAVAEQVSTHLENLRLSEELQKRATELQAVAQVSASVSTNLETSQLLKSVVELTKEQFDLYHVHVYLLNEAQDVLELKASTGEVGRQMMAQGRHIPMLDEHSLVVRAVHERKGLVLNDVRALPGFLVNPLLPETRSELAVPILAGQLVLGVLDVQSDYVNRFTEEDVRINTTLAAQVAVALQNAILYTTQLETAEHLRDVDKLKSAFLANMSHELRTPLNSIIGFTEVIMEGMDGPLTERQTHDMGLVHKNSLHLLNLITDVLDMAKIEAGKLTLSLEPFDFRETLDEVVETIASLTRSKNLTVTVAAPTRLDIHGDRMRLRQVMLNLVNNAIKFSERGGNIQLESYEREGRLCVSVHDQGLGIPPEQLESIFKEFHQVDTSATRKVGGTGLGLPISRHLVEMHGGKLWAESTGVAGEGSIFIFELPTKGYFVEPVGAKPLG